MTTIINADPVAYQLPASQPTEAERIAFDLKEKLSWVNGLGEAPIGITDPEEASFYKEELSQLTLFRDSLITYNVSSNSENYQTLMLIFNIVSIRHDVLVKALSQWDNEEACINELRKKLHDLEMNVRKRRENTRKLNQM